MNNNDSNQASSGVQQLIDKLRQEGIDAGQKEAEQILIDARRRAEAILGDAKQKADHMVKAAQQDAEKQIQSVRDALKLAFRDSLLALKENITVDFSLRLKRLVKEQMRDEVFLKQLILEIAGRSLPENTDNEPIEILLPENLLDMEKLRHQPYQQPYQQQRSSQEDSLAHFVSTMATEHLREGVTIRSADSHDSGIRVRIVNQDIELNLTDEGISDLLLEYLTPRYRALLEGIVN
jgi:V/A-type H+-transporting ATPase subunit E